MQIYEWYAEDVSFHHYNLEIWDSSVAVTWECIQCGKTIKGIQLRNTVKKSRYSFLTAPIYIHGFLLSIIKMIFRNKSVIPSYCESCLEDIGVELFCTPSDIDKMQQYLLTNRKNSDSSLNMELEEFKDSVLPFSRGKHAEVIRRKIQNILTGPRISREEFIAQLKVPYRKKRSLKRLNIFYDKADRYWKCVQENTDHQTALDECSQKVLKLANIIAERYIGTECKDNFWDGECRQKYKEYELNWNRWYKTLKPCVLIVLYKYVSQGGAMLKNQEKIRLKGAEIRLIKQTLPAKSAWINRNEKILKKSSQTKEFIATHNVNEWTQAIVAHSTLKCSSAFSPVEPVKKIVGMSGVGF